MPITKQPLSINFSQGLDKKTDPFQVPVGKFSALENCIFDKGGMLQKRNGFAALTPLLNNSNTFVTTFNGNLTAIGTSLNAYSSSTNQWFNKGSLVPASLSVLPLIRSNTNQIAADSVVASNGYVLTTFIDRIPVGGSLTSVTKYVMADSVTGQNIIEPQAIPVSSGVVSGYARAFVLGRYFIIVFTNTIGSTPHLQYIAITIANPTIVSTNTDISALYTPTATTGFDGFVSNNNLYLAWNAPDGGKAIRVSYLTSTLTLGNSSVFIGHEADIISITVDSTQSTPVAWISWYDASDGSRNTLAVNAQLIVVLAPTVLGTGGVGVSNITSTAQNSVMTLIYEVPNNIDYDNNVPWHEVRYLTVTQAGVVGSQMQLRTGVGLASKAILVNNVPRFLVTYQSAYQPTYFLIDMNNNIIAKLAYSNGFGYYTQGLPSMSLIDSNTISCAYIVKDLVEAQTKNTAFPNVTGVYAQTGINQVTFEIGGVPISTAEIGQNLNISGGFLWSYDGYSVVEQEFFLYPDFVELTASTTGGNMDADTYYYQVTYEWADNQGNLFRSAPSIPVSVTTTGTTSSVLIQVPCLSMTLKSQNPVKIVIYRWSTSQQIYYQVTSIQTPLLNVINQDSVSALDTATNAAITGNNIIYTTGGVLENIAPPATNLITLFDTRLWLVDAEDPNLLWFSKPVIENTPVEMTDLQTFYVAPTTGAQGSTGPITAMSALDDKLILFKKDAIYYINGVGPDITGSNNQYSQPIFITATVGSANQDSIVFMPNGLMFQSDKGIWLLGRDLSTDYIGAPVQTFTQGSLVKAALNIPGTNQVRFTMDSGVTLMYDYFYKQWGTFTNIPAISSTLYQSLHTYIDSLGKVFKEEPNFYLDDNRPVKMSFTSSWITLSGIQGLQRFFELTLLGVYITPFTLNVKLAFDYNDSNTQSTTVTPDNYVPNYGGDAVWGSSTPWGGKGNVFRSRIFPQIQKCESFQITVDEQYDPSKGLAAGAGLTLSGMNLLVGILKGSRNSPASRSFG